MMTFPFVSPESPISLPIALTQMLHMMTFPFVSPESPISLPIALTQMLATLIVGVSYIYTDKSFNCVEYLNQALTNAWKDACGSKVVSTVLIPKGTYFLGPVRLVGPCWSPSIEFRIEGTVVAPMDSAALKTNGWVTFRYIYGLTISGGGTFDGQGQTAWAHNDCAKNPKCQQYPAVRFSS